MHAQTISTTAQANEVVSGRATATLTAATAAPVALEACIAEIERFTRDVVRPAQRAHTAAEEAELAARAAGNHEVLKQATNAEAKADRVWIRAYEKRDRLIAALLEVPVANAGEALRKAEAAVSLSSDGKFTLATTNDYALLKDVTGALARDIASLGATPSRDPSAWAAAVARRDEVRAEIAAYAERERSDPSQEQQDALSEAEFAVYTTPAPDLAGVLWKLADNMKDDWGSQDLSAILENCDISGDLGEVAQASVYRDLQRLAGAYPPLAASPPVATSAAAFLPELDRRWAIEAQADHNAGLFAPDLGITDEELTAACDYTGAVAHRIIATPGHSIADFQAKARAVIWCACNRPEDWEADGTINRFAKSLVLELLGHTPTPVDEAKLAEWDAAGEALIAQGGIPSAPHAIAAE